MHIQCRWSVVVAALALVALVGKLRAQKADPPDRVARIAYLSGDVSMISPDAQDWSAAPPNYPMISGSRLYTGDDARAAIQNGSIDVRMGHDTDVTLTNLTDNYEQLGLAQGAIRVRVYGLDPGSMVEVDTPNGAVIIQQPGDYRVNVYQGQGSLVEVNSGSLEITGPGVNQEVDQDEAVQLWGTDQVQVGMVEMPAFDDLDNWSISRDQHIMNSVSARYVSREMPGYDDLDDSGNWSDAPDYGPVWYPANMPSGWAPYTFGHWAYVAPWGWTWVDDASWGYAPFHYGRWAVISGRWGWVPGPPAVVPVYSPALVAFVGGPHFSIGISIGGGGVAAWFPLGVGEPYVPWYRCSPTYVRTVNVTNVNVTYIHNTTIINNYNTFISNTRVVKNVNEIHIDNVRYTNRDRVIAVPENMMSQGTRVQHAQVRLDDQQRQQLMRAPVDVARPPMAAPSRPPMLQVKTNVPRPVAAPRLLTPHGPAAATPAANNPRFNPSSLPKPQPSAEIRPATRTIAPNLRPANGPRYTPRPGPGTPPGQANPPGQENRPAPTPPEANRPVPGNQQRPGFEQPPQNESRPSQGPGFQGGRNAGQPPNEGAPPRQQPPQPQPEYRPVPPQQPAYRPAPPTPQPNPTQPSPPQPRPQPQPEYRPVPPQQPQYRPQPPEQHPNPPQPENRPAPPPPPQPRPQPQPEYRPAQPPPPQPRPQPQPESRPAPPPPPPQQHGAAPNQPPRPDPDQKQDHKPDDKKPN